MDDPERHRDRLSPEQRSKLWAVYELERHDEHSANSSYSTLLAATLTLLAAIGVVLLQNDAPGWVYAVLPLAPVPLVSLMSGLVRRNGLRSAYIDACEELLEERIGGLVVPSQHRAAHRDWRRGVGAANVLVVLGVFSGMYVGVLIQSYRAAANHGEQTLGLAILGLVSVLLLVLVTQIVVGLKYRSIPP